MNDALGQEQLIQLAADWILENSPNARAAKVKISARTSLLKEGFLDSLGLVDLVAFLENTTGNQIDILELNEDDLVTLQGLCSAARNTGQCPELP